VTDGRIKAWAFVRGLPWYRFAAGALAGGAGLLVTFLLRAFGLGVFVPEIAVDFAVGRIPGAVESFFIRSLGEGAKLLALGTALIVFLILPGVYAAFYRRVQRWLKNRWAVMAFYTFSTAGILLLVVLPLLGEGLLGAGSSVGVGFAVFSQLIGSWIYAAVLDYLLVDVAAEYPEGFSLSRRQFIVGSIGAIAVAALTVYGLATLVAKKGRLAFTSFTDLLNKEVTPTDEFYVVTKNVIDPAVMASTWQLAVGGIVSNPTTYSYRNLLDMVATNDPSVVEEFVTLECVSNDVGGNLISTAKWKGVRLASLLQSAGLDSTTDWIVFTCADDYTAAVPLAKAMDPNTIVAVLMNDGQLTRTHGFPARIIVPGLYGMFHAKWITRIEAVHGEYLGYWQQKGWTNRGQIHTTAIIVTPPDNAVVGSSATIGGVAFAGDRGISTIEVSTDGGLTWNPAMPQLPPKSNLTWVLWRYDWAPRRSGSFRIFARARDGAGILQESSVAPPFPNGSTGYDSITLLVQ
jgi:DMSO/TMAO reductase YedYZ molybdopterin-dependent catalytic subunit